MSNEFIKGLCIIVVFVAIGAVVYSIINAFVVSKRNKKQEAVNKQIFMAQNGLLNKDVRDVQRHANIRYDNGGLDRDDYSHINHNTRDEQRIVGQNALDSILNYDDSKEEQEEIVPNGKSLRDFYSN